MEPQLPLIHPMHPRGVAKGLEILALVAAHHHELFLNFRFSVLVLSARYREILSVETLASHTAFHG